MLCLAGTLTVLVESASAVEYMQNVDGVTINSQNDFNHFMTFKSWQARALEEMNDLGKSKSFITNPYYKESILKVISKAIADCFWERNEFAKFWKNHRENFNSTSEDSKSLYLIYNFVEFDVTPSNLTYKREHWNAFILYNLLNVLLNSDYRCAETPDTKGKTALEVAVEQIGGEIFDNYAPQYYSMHTQKEKGIDDIKQYARALNLEDYISELRKSKLTGGQFKLNNVTIPKDKGYRQIGTGRRRGKHYGGEFIVTWTNKTAGANEEIHDMFDVSVNGITHKQIVQEEFDKCLSELNGFLDNDEEPIRNDNNIISKDGPLNALIMPKANPNYKSKFPSVTNYRQNNPRPNTNNIRTNSVANENIIIAPKRVDITNNKAITSMPSRTLNNMNNQNNMMSRNNVNMNMNNNMNIGNMNNNMNMNMNMNNMNNINNQGFMQNNNVNMNMNNNMNMGNMNMNNMVNNMNFVNNQSNMNNINNQNFVQNNNVNMNMNMNMNNNMNMGNMNMNNMVNNMNFVNNQSNMNNINNQNFVQNNNMPIQARGYKLFMRKLRNNLSLVNTNLRAPDTIHNLCHSIPDHYITNAKCYFNSTMQVLANSQLLMERINKYRQERNKLQLNPGTKMMTDAISNVLVSIYDGSMDGAKNYRYGLQPADPSNPNDPCYLYPELQNDSYDAVPVKKYESAINQIDEASKAYYSVLLSAGELELYRKSRQGHWLNDVGFGYSVITCLEEIMPMISEALRFEGKQIVQIVCERDGKSNDIQNEDFKELMRGGVIVIPAIKSLDKVEESSYGCLQDFLNARYYNATIKHLPSVLMFTNSSITQSKLKPNTSDPNEREYFNVNPAIKYPEEFSLQLDNETHKYKINGYVYCQSSEGNHFKPCLRTSDGWYTIDDRYKDKLPTKLMDIYDPNFVEHTSNGPVYHKWKELVLYERVSITKN